MDINQHLIYLAKKTMVWLASCQVKQPGYNQGGILDPLDKRVIGDHYATTHFAWACAILFKKTQDSKWFERSKAAIQFHMRTSPEEYPPGNWSYHWDFNNLAFIETFSLLLPYLSDSEQQKWKRELLKWKTNTHSAVNWLAMRALAAYHRGTLLNRDEDVETGRKLLTRVLSAQKADGVIDDVPNESRPSQYHAYTACLLYRMMPLDPENIPPAVIKAARWLLSVTAPDGDMNAMGRGQGQIFGYVCAVYLFSAASILDKKFGPQYKWAVNLILSKINQYHSADGWLPLVLNDSPVDERAGWYDYHHLTVYNAFAALWLLLAEEMAPHVIDAALPPPGVTFLPDSGVLSVCEDQSFSLWTAGDPGIGYAVDAGITPHLLYFGGDSIFRYPVGPGPGKYGKNVKHLNQIENIWAPLIENDSGEWIAPFGGKGDIKSVNKQCWNLTYRKEGITWSRLLIIGKHFIEARDKIGLPKGMAGKRIRLANIAIKPEHANRVGPNAFLTNTGHCFKLWGDRREAELKKKVTAADGTVQIIAVEDKANSRKELKGGWRLRKSPEKKANKLSGILCLSWDPWSVIWKRKQKLLFEMSDTGRAGKVLYVEPPVTITRIIEGYRHWFAKTETGQLFYRAMAGKINRERPYFNLLTPVLPFPGQRTFRRIRFWNKRAHVMRIKNSLKKLKLKNYILWLYHPSQIELVDELAPGAELVVYDWTDDWVAAFPPDRPDKDRQTLAWQQEELLKRVDVVFGVSKKLCDRAAAYCPWVYYLPNATDLTVFKPLGQEIPMHSIFKGLARPYLVYLSQITDRVDFNLIANLALRKPEWQFFLVGPLVCQDSLVAPLREISNVHLPGKLPYKEAAQVAAQADVCILPHIQDELTATLDPIKLYDYLATGKPVVATDVAMNPALRPYVSIARGLDVFELAVSQALREPEEMKLKRREAIMEHGWRKRAKSALDILGKFFD